MSGKPLPAVHEQLDARFRRIEEEVAALRRQVQAARPDAVSRPHQLSAVDVGARTDDTYYRVSSWHQGYGQSDVLALTATVQVHYPDTGFVDGDFRFRVIDDTSTYITESSVFDTTPFVTQDLQLTLNLLWLHPFQINEWDARNTPDDADLRVTPIDGTQLQLQAKRVDGTYNLIVGSPHIRYSTPEVYPDASDVGVWTLT